MSYVSWIGSQTKGTLDQEEQVPAESTASAEAGEAEGIKKGPGEQAERESPPLEESAPLQAPDLYDPQKCDLHFTITMRRDDGDPQGRQTLLGVRNDSDDPLIMLVRAQDLESLLVPLMDLYDRLVADLPRRKVSMQARLEATQKRKPEAAAKQATPKIGAKETKASATTPSGNQPNSSTSGPGAASAAMAQATKSSTKRKGLPEAGSQTEQMTLF